MKFVWNKKPGSEDPSGGIPIKPIEQVAGARETLNWDRGRMEAAKLFNESFQKRKTDKPRMDKLSENLKTWNSPKTEEEAASYIELMRRGGVKEEDNLKYFYERHVRLASAYLKPIEGEQYSYEFEFGKDKVAYWRVGAADILPHCFNVCIFNTKTQGSNVLGVRTVNPSTGREGFYRVDDLKLGQYTYIAVFDGDRAKLADQEVITSTLEDLRVNAKISAKEKSTLSAYTGTKANMVSHIGIYTKGAARDDHSDSSELLYNPVSKIEYADPLTALQARREASKNRSQKDLMELKKAMAPPELGNLTGVRKDIVANARRYLLSQNQNYFKENYYNRDAKYRGGELGCAITVTHILKESGVILNKSPSVAGAEAEMQKCGWTKKTLSEALPGDVVVWGKTARINYNHIGIITRNGYALNNSSKRGYPIESPIVGKRPVTAIYSPPNIEERAAAIKNKAAVGPLPEGKKVETSPHLGDKIRERLRPYEEIINTASRRFQVPVNLIMAVIFQESGGRINTASHAGAGGLMQLMPSVARNAGLTVYPTIKKVNSRGKPYYLLDPRDDRTDPYKCIMGGTRLLGILLRNNRGNVERTLASYNWGSGNLSKFDKGLKSMPTETKNYIKRVPAYMAALEASESKRA